MFFSASLFKKIKNLRKRALNFLCNDYETWYAELLSKSSTSSMNVKILKELFVESYKTIDYLNPNFMRDFLSYDSPVGLSVKNIK